MEPQKVIAFDRWTGGARSLRRLVPKGFRLVVRLHTAHFRTGVADRPSRIGIDLSGNGVFATRLWVNTGAIVELSSAALLSALLGLPRPVAKMPARVAEVVAELVCVRNGVSVR